MVQARFCMFQFQSKQNANAKIIWILHEIKSKIFNLIISTTQLSFLIISKLRKFLEHKLSNQSIEIMSDQPPSYQLIVLQPTSSNTSIIVPPPPSSPVCDLPPPPYNESLLLETQTEFLTDAGACSGSSQRARVITASLLLNYYPNLAPPRVAPSHTQLLVILILIFLFIVFFALLF